MTADRVAQLVEVHRGAAFPSRWRADEVAGVDMVLLDADVAGHVTTWLAGGRLDGGSREVLRRCLRDADRALAELTDAAEITYARRLRDLAAGVLG